MKSIILLIMDYDLQNDDALRMVFNSLSCLQQYFEDPLVQEIMINAPHVVFIERAGEMKKLDIELPAGNIAAAITVLASRANKELREDTADSVLNERWPGVRICAVLPPVALNGPAMSIRKHSSVKYKLSDYVASNTIDQKTYEILMEMIRQRKNLLIVGGTGSGKTTFLKAVIDAIDPVDRILSIEDLPELDIQKPNVISMETREGVGIDYSFLVKTALRLRPDRIILGEVRGAAALDLLNAANTGHDGCISTLHANSSFEGLARMEDMVMQSGTSIPIESIQQRIASTFDYVLFMARRNGNRKLIEIINLESFDLQTRQYKFNYVFKEEK